MTDKNCINLCTDYKEPTSTRHTFCILCNRKFDKYFFHCPCCNTYLKNIMPKTQNKKEENKPIHVKIYSNTARDDVIYHLNTDQYDNVIAYLEGVISTQS